MMKLDNTDKKKLVQFISVVAIGAGVFFLFKPKPRKSLKKNDDSMKELPSAERVKMELPLIDEAAIGDNTQIMNAYTALQAYIQAYNEGEPQEELDALNKDLANDMGVRVVRSRLNDKLVVKDLNDKELIVFPSES
jgi:hypothetical protein